MGIAMKWIGQWGALRAIREARALLDMETPLKTNCGKLCGGACCLPEEDGENGMLLFPYEEKLYARPIAGFSFHLAGDDTLRKGGFRLVCEGACPREHRPLACRLFPLRIRMECDPLGNDTHAIAEIDPRAWAVCPLPEEGSGRLNAFQPSFVQAVENAGNVLLQNVYMLEFLTAEQKWLDEMRRL